MYCVFRLCQINYYHTIPYNYQHALVVYRPGHFTVHPPPPALSGPKCSNSENCCGSENAMPPKVFWDMEGHRGHFRSKNVFFFQKTYYGKNS